MNGRTSNYESQIVGLVKKLTTEQQFQVLKSIKKQIILENAKILDESVLQNNITMAEIVKEVAIIRKKRNGPIQINN